MSAAAKSATPTNSLTRREAVDPLTRSDLHNHRQHERPPPGAFAKKTAQLDAQFLLDESLVRALFEARLLDDVAEQPRAIREQRLAIFHHEAARDDVGYAFERAGLFVDRDDGNDEAFLRQMTAVAEHFVADLAGARIVDQHAADRCLAGDASTLFVERDDVAVFGEENLGPRIAPGEHAFRHARVLRQLPVLAVDRNEVAWFHQREHQLQLF